MMVYLECTKRKGAADQTQDNVATPHQQVKKAAENVFVASCQMSS